MTRFFFISRAIVAFPIFFVSTTNRVHLVPFFFFFLSNRGHLGTWHTQKRWSALKKDETPGAGWQRGDGT
jgi:hypothetical protein